MPRQADFAQAYEPMGIGLHPICHGKSAIESDLANKTFIIEERIFCSIKWF